MGWGGVGGIFRMEADLDSEQKTRRGGMNINNILCRKIVTMDIIERRWEASSWPCLMYVCLQMCTSRLSTSVCSCSRLPVRQSVSEWRHT